MSIRKPLLAALIAALLFLLYRWDRAQLVDARTQLVQTSRLIPFDFKDATMVGIENSGGHFVLEKRGPDDWQMKEPRQLRADTNQIKTLVDNLHASKKTESFEPKNLADYGLDHPLPRLTVHGKSEGVEMQFTLLVGSASNRVGRYYAMLEGESEVFTVGDWIRNQGLVGMQHLRDKTLLHFSPEDVSKIRLGLPNDPITVERTSDESGPRKWWIPEMKRPANESLVELALRTVSMSSAIRIEDNPTTPTSELGLAPPSLQLGIFMKDGSEASLALGRKLPGEDRVYARAPLYPDSVAVVRMGFVEPFLRGRRDWGTKRFLWSATKEYTRIETSSGTSKMTLAHDPQGNWVFEDMPGVPIHPEKLAIFLDALANWSGKEYVAEGVSNEDALKEYKIRAEGYKLTATLADGTVEGFEAGLNISDEGSVYVRRIQDNSIWKVDGERLHFVRVFRADLQDKRIDHGWAENVAAFDYADIDLGVGFKIENRGGVWVQRTEGNHTNVLAAAAVGDFLHAVEELEWDSFSVLSADDQSKARLEFRDDKGQIVYWFEEVPPKDKTKPRDSVSLRTPKGVFDVPVKGYKRVVDQLALLLQTAREPAK